MHGGKSQMLIGKIRKEKYVIGILSENNISTFIVLRVIPGEIRGFSI